MKLVWKLVLAILAGMLAIIVVNAFVRVRVEVALFREDMKRDHERLAQVLAAAAGEAWHTGGEERVRAILARAEERFTNLHIRWMRPDSVGVNEPLTDVSRLELRETGVAQIEIEENDPKRLVTYATTRAGDMPPGAIELVKNLDIGTQVRDVIVRDTVLAAAGLAALSALVLIVLGVRLVGRPMRQLVEKARRIGSGDLSGPLDLPQKDEIGELAKEMNAMCCRLDEARTRLAEETSGRVQALTELRHVDRLRTVGQLAAGVAHEIGTPLNIVAARAKLIRTGEARGQAAEDCARSIAEQTERISGIVRQLLGFARTSGMQKAPADLREVARRALTLVEPLAAKAGVAIAAPEDGRPIVVRADPTQIEQVVMNIALNGIQAMKERRGRLCIDVCRRYTRPPSEHGGPEDEYACVEISDEGPGIPARDIERLFEPFFTTKGVGEGTGLGLSVAYGIVREHGGWIDVASEVGRGSRFCVYLPQEDETASALAVNDKRRKEEAPWRQDRP